jgi:hypothetical protein
MENWKQFQGTELGSLLGQIYGNNRPKIQYPKFKTSTLNIPKKDWLPGGGKVDAVDPRKATRKPVNINVPKLTGHASETNLEIDSRIGLKAIDVIPKRKGAEIIKQELDDIRMRQERYRPAYVKPVSVDAEKDRLNQIFTFKGGKGLPTELTHPEGEMPMERVQRLKEKERMEAIKIKRGLATLPSVSTNYTPTLSVQEQMAEQITEEINNRRKYLEEMKELGSLKPADERRLKMEISSKLTELEKLGV